MDEQETQLDENRLYPFPWFYDLFRDTGSMVSEQRSLVEQGDDPIAEHGAYTLQGPQQVCGDVCKGQDAAFDRPAAPPSNQGEQDDKL